MYRAVSYGKDVVIGEKGFFVSSTLLYRLNGILWSLNQPALPSLHVMAWFPVRRLLVVGKVESCK